MITSMYRIILLLIIFCKFTLCEDGSSENDAPIVITKQGRIRGLEFENVVSKEKFYAFMSIPYAAPPLGGNRFKYPMEPDSWEGIRESSEEKLEGCLRYNIMFKNVEGEEDCLYLHIFTPKKPEELQENLRPVMVWIHGGGFNLGSGDPYLYGPDFLLLQDVIIVNINYRLAVFGFLCTSDSEASGNAGLKDQVMALKWVQSNIKSFGGDPNLVTIFGESAGGASVHYLVLSPTTKGLFHRAIAQSGSALCPWALNRLPENSAIKLGKVFDCNSSEMSEIIKCLRDVDGKDLANYQYNIFSTDDLAEEGFLYVPCVERQSVKNAFLTEQPKDIVMQGKFTDVPFMAGTVMFETRALAKVLTASFVPDDLKKRTIKNMNKHPEFLLPLHWEINDPARKKRVNKMIKKFYFGKERISNLTLDNLVNETTDTNFLLGTHNMMTYHSTLAKSPVYQYYMIIDSDYGKVKQRMQMEGMKGPVHADDVCYLFYIYESPQKLDKEGTGFKTMSKVTKLWANFAKYGNPTPNSEMGFIWAPVKPDKRSYLEIDKELSVKEFVEEERMKFWEELRVKENLTDFL